MHPSAPRKPLAVTLVAIASILGVSTAFVPTASAECTGSDCEETNEETGGADSREGDERLERARKLRDRGIERMDENKEEALELLERSLQLNPDDGLTWANHGTVLLNLGRHEEALESYERSLEKRPDHAYTHCSVASVYNETDRHEKAIEAANRAIQVDPEFAPAYLNKARALEAMGEQERAAKLRERAVELDPSLEDRTD